MAKLVITNASTIYSLFVGALLLASSVLKIHSFGSSLSFQVLYFFHPAIFHAIVLGELLLGCWHLFGERTRTLYVVTAIVFAAFAIVNLTMMYSGRDSCGCLGSAVHASPFWMLLLDVLVSSVAAIAAICVTARPIQAIRYVVTGAAFVIGLMVFSLVSSQAESLVDGLYIEPGSLNFGDLTATQPNHRTLTLHNSSAIPITVLGAQSTCGTDFNQDFPLTIDADSSATVSVTVKPVKAIRGQQMVRHLRIWTDSDLTPVVDQEFFGWVN